MSLLYWLEPEDEDDDFDYEDEHVEMESDKDEYGDDDDEDEEEDEVEQEEASVASKKSASQARDWIGRRPGRRVRGGKIPHREKMVPAPSRPGRAERPNRVRRRKAKNLL